MRTFNYHMLARISVKPWDSLKSAIIGGVARVAANPVNHTMTLITDPTKDWRWPTQWPQHRRQSKWRGRKGSL